MINRGKIAPSAEKANEKDPKRLHSKQRETAAIGIRGEASEATIEKVIRINKLSDTIASFVSVSVQAIPQISKFVLQSDLTRYFLEV